MKVHVYIRLTLQVGYIVEKMDRVCHKVDEHEEGVEEVDEKFTTRYSLDAKLTYGGWMPRI